MKHSFKRVISLLLSVMMIISMLPTAALADEVSIDNVNVIEDVVSSAEDAVVQIDGIGYASLNAALAAAKTEGSTEVEITVLSDIALSTAVVDFDKVTFTGTNREQTIDLNLNSAFEDDVELVFNNLTVSRLDSDWLYHWFYVKGGLTFNNCEMIGLFVVTAQDTDFINCYFYNDDTFGDGNYSLWLYNCYEGVVVNITDCTFDVYERAIKIYGDGYTGEMTLNISGTEFTSRTADKTVVEMAYANSTGKGSMNLNITDSTATDFGAPEHIVGEANAWFNVEGTDTVSTVTVDGDVVYTDVEPEIIEIYDWDDLKELDARVEGGDMLEGAIVKLMNDINLYEMGEDGEPVTFNPIGANKAYFKGTFDGQGHTIKNMYQSGWALGYDWDNYGTIGLFAYLWDATVKNLTIENAECFVEGGNVAGIAGCAWGNCTFENITIKNSTYATYNNRAAGIVGYTGGEGTMTFKNVTVDEDTVIAALWGSYDCTLGGVVGSTQDPTQFVFEDVSVSCKLDCYNDVTASYKWYSYRMCGMLIGRMNTLQEDAPTEVDPRGYVTIQDVDITIGEWANQTYIWDDSLSKGCQRVEAGYSYGGVDVSKYPDAEITQLGFSTIIGGPQSQSKGYYGSDITKLRALDGFDTSTLRVNDIALEIRSRVAQNGDTYYTDLQTAINEAKAGDTVTLLADVTITTYVTIDKSITLDLGGKTVTRASGTGLYINNADAEVVIQNGSVVAGGEGIYVNTAKQVDIKNVNAKSTGKAPAVYMQTSGVVNIYSGTYETAELHDGAYFTLNIYDSNRANCTFNVYGGTFVNFNPANNTAEGAGTSFCAAGYTAEQDGDNYIVVEDLDSQKPVVTITFTDSNNGEMTLKYPSKRYDSIQKLIGTNDYADFVLGAEQSELLAYIADGRASNIVMTLHEDIELDAPINFYNKYFQVAAEYDITIDGNGHTITWADGYTGTLMNVESGVSVTTKNLTIDGENAFTFYEDTTTVEDGQNWYTRFVNVGEEDKAVNADVIVNAGSLTLGVGTKIQNITIASDGANGKTENTETGYVLKYNDDLAVIKSNGGTVTMNGAEITGNAGMILNAIDASTVISGSKIDGNMGCGNKGGIIVADKGTMLINGGSISGNKAMARSATVLGVINGAEVTFNTTMDNNKHIGVGSNTAGAIVVLEGASQFVMNGGSISNNVGGRAGAIASRWVGGNYGQHEENSIVLNAGTITGNTAASDSWNGASVFLRSPATIGEGMTVDGTIAVNAAPGELDITGGTFNGSLIVTDGLTAEITGGTFNYDPAEWCAEGYAPKKNADGTWTVDVATYIAQVGETKYTDLKKALEACTNGETVQLLADITYDANDVVYAHGGATGFGKYDQYNPSIIYLGGTKGATEEENQPSNVNAVLDLNGHTITCNAEAYLFLIMDNAKVTFKDSVGTGSITNNSTNYPAIWAVGTETLVTIESGKYVAASATGLLHSTHSGDLVINGGDFRTTAADASLLIMLNSQPYNNPNYFLKGVATVTVNGGVFHGFNPEKVGDDYGASSIADIKFVDAVAPEKKADLNEDGTYGIVDYVAWIKAELLAGNDVTLTKDVTVDGSMIESIPAPTNGNGKYPNYGIFNVVGDYEVTFDLNGHTITYNGHKDFQWNGKTYNSCTVAHGLFYANAGAHLTVKDGSDEQTGTVKVYGLASGAYVASNDTKFTIEGGTWKNEPCATCGGTNIFLYPLQGGELYITGGHFEQALDANGDSYLIVEHGGEYKNSVIDYSKTKVEISGGTFVGMNPSEIKYFQQTADNKLDTTSKPITDGCASGFEGVQNADGTYGVQKIKVVEMDGVKYESFKDALATLSSADTTVHKLKVLVDHEIDVNYSTFNYPILINGFAVEIDLNGKTITADWSKYAGTRADNALIGMANGGKLTIIDSVGGGTIRNMSDGKDDVENRIFWLSNAHATKETILTIEGGTFIQEEDIHLLYVEGLTASSDKKGYYTYIKGGHFELIGYDDFFNSYDGRKHETVISGGTFNVDPTDWELKIADGYKAEEVEDGLWGIVPNKIFEMHLVDANGEAHWLSPMSSNDLNSLLATCKVWYESLQGTYSFTMKLLDDCTISESIVVNYPMTIDLNGKTITTVEGVNPAFRITSGADVTVKNATMDTDGYCFILGASDGSSVGNLTIESGKFHGGTSVASVTKGTLTIKGGEFSVEPYQGSYDFLLNCIDANYKTGDAKIEVIGGTFANFNPANNAAEGTGTSFVPTGYEAVANGDNTWTVVEVKNYVAQIGDVKYTSLQDAIDDAATGDTIQVLTDLNLDTTELITNSGGYSTVFNVAEKNVTIDLNTKTITVNAKAADLTDAKDNMLMGVFTVDTNGGLTLKNGTVEVKANDATVYALATCYGAGGTLTFESGTYTADVVDSALIYSQYDEVVTVKDGTYTLGNVGKGPDGNGSPWIFNAKGQNTANVIVIGGTYNADVFHQYYIFEVKDTTEVAEMLKVPAKAAKDNGDGTWTIVDAVAYVNEQHWSGAWYAQNTGYATLQEAVNAVKDVQTKNGKTSGEEYVTLLTDITLTDAVKINKSLRLELNNKTLTGELTLTDAEATLTSEAGLNVTTNVAGCKVVYEDGVYKVVEGAELFDITSANVVLGNELAMYFYVKNADLNGEDYVAVVTKSYADGRENLVVEIPYSEWEARDDGRMRFKFDGIAAKEMADNINVVVKVASTGENASNAYNDSIRSYVNRAFASGAVNGELATILVDMLNYGAAAQKAFNYGLNDLANNSIDAYQSHATPSVTCENNQEKGEGYRSSTLTLESKITLTMLFYKTTVTTDMTAIVSYTDHYGKKQEVQIEGSNFEDRGSAWGVEIDNLVVADAKQIITCTFIDADGNEVTGVYGKDSIESYCARAIAATGDDYYEYIMKFANAAYNFFH